MDPQKLSQLDPKLRDAYQRVMGTTIPQSQPAPAPTPELQPEPISVPNTQSAASPEPFFIPQPAANPEPQVPMQQPPTQNFTTPPPMPAQTTVVKKKSGIMIPILFGIAALVFLVIYTLFWTKIFNFRLPFLP